MYTYTPTRSHTHTHTHAHTHTHTNTHPHCRIIEVEPSVNVKGGQGGEIVQVYHNQIIGIRKIDEVENERDISPARR